MKYILLLFLSIQVYADDGFKYGYFYKECKDKKSSIQFKFFTQKLKCKSLKDWPYIYINWTENLPKFPLKKESFIFNEEKGVEFKFCPFKDKCEFVDQLGVEFTSLNNDSGEGKIILKRKNGKFLKSEFKLKYCGELEKPCKK